ncbi:MAG: SCO family protein [Rhodocyclales bacterium]|nr:SCO family protein [Rhodocyclales bacterium]
MLRGRIFRAVCLPALLLFCSTPLFAAQDGAQSVSSRPLDPALAPNVPVLDQGKALELSQSVVNRPVGDYVLLNREGKPVRLADYRGKPLLVSFIYTGCFEVCPTTTKNLQKAVTNTVAVLGADRFNVASIGFNQPFDSPSALKSFATQNGIVFPNWEFLSPAQAILADLTAGFGFSYAATPAGFDHIVQVTLVDAEGNIYRQIYGEALTADMLVEPLKQLIAGAPVPQSGAVADLADRVRILCSVYDPNTGQYRLNYVLFFEIGGFLTFIGYMLWYVRRGPRHSKNA